MNLSPLFCCCVAVARNSVATKFTHGSSQSVWLQNICYDEYDNITMKDDDVLNESRDWQTFRQYLLNISQPCSKMLLQCRFALDTYKCMEIFDTGEKEAICIQYISSIN